MFFGIGFMGFAVWLVSVLYAGFAITMLWSWFIVPFGVMHITFPWAIGLSCLAGMFKGIPASSGNDESAFSELLKPYIVITLSLIVGYIAHLFM